MEKNCNTCDVKNRDRYGSINQLCMTCKKISNWIETYKGLL